MSKAKQKRIRKELDKLFNAGRYWQWLEAVEQEGLIHEHQTKWQEVWQTLARRSFRDPLKMDEFLDRSVTLKQCPDLPDVRFLSLLKGFIEEDKDPQELSSVKGVSPPAELIRKQVLLWREDAFPRQRLQKTLEGFISSPGNRTRRHYEEVASLLNETSFSPTIRDLGRTISLLGSGKERSGLGCSRSKQEEIESTLKRAHIELLPSAYQILAYPFLCKISKTVEHLLDGKREDDAFEMASSMPFVFSLLRGGQTESFKARESARPLATRDDADVDKIVGTGDFEEKIALLGRIRTFHRGVETDDRRRVDMKTLYEAVFGHVKRIRKDLPLQEQKDIGAALGTALIRDLPFISNVVGGGERDLIEILRHAGEAMCLEVRLAMLLLVLAEKRGDRRLTESAREFLKNHEKPTKEDILWVFDQFLWIVFPRITLLRPLLALWEPEDPLVREIAGVIFSRAIFAFSVTSSGDEGDLFSFILQGDEFGMLRKDLHTLRRELLLMKEWSPLAAVSDYLQCFPDDTLSEGGYSRLLEMAFEKGGSMGAVLDMMEKLTPIAQIPSEMPNLLPFLNPPADHSAMLERAFYSFLVRYWQDLKVMKMQSLDRLVRTLLREGSSVPKDHLLFRMGNLLDERARAGEPEASALKETVMAFLARLNRRGNKTGSRKRRHRSEELH